MGKTASILTLLLLAGLLGAGMLRLLTLRFNRGDVFPPASSLRADPMGTKVLFAALQRLPDLGVRRHFRDASRLPDGPGTTLFMLHADAGDLNDDDFLRDTLGRFVTGGGRLVLTLAPRPPGVGGKDEWNSRLGLIPEPFPHMSDGARAGKEKPVLRRAIRAAPPPGRPAPEEPLEAQLPWRGSSGFAGAGDDWTVLYECLDTAVILERRVGRGSVVICGDTYFLSNEAMLGDRSPALLAHLVGTGARQVLVDEAHLGVRHDPGVASLLREYRLHGLAGGLALLAALFIWKSNSPLLRPVPDPDPGSADAAAAAGDKAAVAGLENLLRRNLPAGDLLLACREEWLAGGGPRGISPDRRRRAEERLDEEFRRPPADRRPKRAYEDVRRILHETPAAKPRRPSRIS